MDFTDLLNARAYDLGQPYFPGMPHFPSHPPFLYSLTKKHGDILYSGAATSAADAIALGTHVGTHIDALSHFSCNGVFYGGRQVEHTYEHGMTELGVETVAPIVRRGVLLDIAGFEGVDVLPASFEVTPDHLSRASSTEINEDDVVLLRTGWGQFFSDAKKYINNTVAPGPGIEAARWLSSRKIFAAGSDTVVFEKTPSPAMPVHTHLLVESGIHIIEVLNLEELARDRVYEFIFVAAPMNIRGGTGAPIRPLAFRKGRSTWSKPLTATHAQLRIERSGLVYVYPGSAGPGVLNCQTVSRLNLIQSPGTIDFIDLV